MSKRQSRSRKWEELDSDDYKRQKKPCEKTGCLLAAPTCCLLSSEVCTVSDHTSRWYHMSLNEHFCNNCFDHYYRTSKTGNKDFSQWCLKWSAVSRASKPSIKGFVSNELLPYWLKCNSISCGKWRCLRKPGILSPEFISKFICNVVSSCDEPEDSVASDVLKPFWMEQLSEPPLLKNSPAGPYLKRFIAQDLGQCPLSSSDSSLANLDFIVPFCSAQCGQFPTWMKPYVMQDYEINFMSRALMSGETYRGIRNLIIAVWSMFPTEWLTVDKVSMYVICRGLSRIYILSESERIIKLLTMKAIINYGLVVPPSDHKFLKVENQCHVLVIGAGISGLACAKHLTNIGVKVSVLEAKKEIGGRICDKPFIGAGAQIVKGIINNPLVILATQAGEEFERIPSDIMLFYESGVPVPDSIVSRMKDQFSGIMQGAIAWATEHKKDSNWHDVISQHQKDFNKLVKFSNDEENVFNFYLRHLEIEMGIALKKTTLLNWEFCSGLLGEDVLFSDGLLPVVTELAKDLNIYCDSEVKTINYVNDDVIVTTKDGVEFKVSKVVVTVPLSVLKKNNLMFDPPLFSTRIQAMEELGEATCEKIILKFPIKFWKSKSNEPYKIFGLVTQEPTFQYFIDTSSSTNSHTLVSYITETMKEIFLNKSYEEIKKICLDVLRKMFKKVPEPTYCYITHWMDDVFCSSYGTYVKVFGHENAYDTLSIDIKKKIYFAGDATFRNCPGTVTGAFFSGLREAVEIVNHLEIE